MELPSNTEGVPHAVFDSTGLVFAVTATMTGGTGQVCTVVVIVLLSMARGWHFGLALSAIRLETVRLWSDSVWMLTYFYC
jgi:hypothetical protein